MRSNVLVIGGAGKVGSALCAKLCRERRTNVICVDNLSTGDAVNIEDLFNLSNFEFVNLDISVHQPWKAIDDKLGRKARYREIYYVASVVDCVENMYKAHIRGVMNALDMAGHHRCGLLILSPEYTRKKISAADLDGAYYYTKKAGESLARSYEQTFRISLSVVECDWHDTSDISDALVTCMRSH